MPLHPVWRMCASSFWALFTVSSRREFSHLNCCSAELCETRGQRRDCVSIQLGEGEEGWGREKRGGGGGGPALISVKNEEGGRRRPHWEPADVKRGVRSGDVNNSLL